MLTNLRDAFRGQSRSPNIVPFHMLGTVSYCAVTFSLRRAVFFPILDFKKCHDLEIRVRGHTMSLKVVSFDRMVTVSLWCSTEALSLRHLFEIFDFKNTVTLKTGLGVRQRHWKCRHSIERIRLPIDTQPATQAATLP